MSSITEADKDLGLAKVEIQAAIEHLSKIVVDKVWGHDEFNHEYKSLISKSFHELLEIRERLA